MKVGVDHNFLPWQQTCPSPAEGRAPPLAMNGMFCKRCGVGLISKHYGVGHGSVPCRPLFFLMLICRSTSASYSPGLLPSRVHLGRNAVTGPPVVVDEWLPPTSPLSPRASGGPVVAHGLPRQDGGAGPRPDSRLWSPAGPSILQLTTLIPVCQ